MTDRIVKGIIAILAVSVGVGGGYIYYRQRVPDGVDTDSDDDWVFQTNTLGNSNGEG